MQSHCLSIFVFVSICISLFAISICLSVIGCVSHPLFIIVNLSFSVSFCQSLFVSDHDDVSVSLVLSFRLGFLMAPFSAATRGQQQQQ